MEKYRKAVEGGADGFIFQNHRLGCLPPTGEIGFGDRPGEIPAVGVSKEVGDRLSRTPDSTGRRPTVQLTTWCRNEISTSRNVEAVVGPVTEQEILLTAHHDAHDIGNGANDNAYGCGLVTGVARLLSQVESKLETAVRVVIFGSEEIGLRGANYWARRNDERTVKCVVNVDGAGYSDHLMLELNTFDELQVPFSAVVDRLGETMTVRHRVNPFGDHWAFVSRGIPAVKVGSISENQGRGWGHTYADTIDKLDRSNFRSMVILLATVMLNLGRADVTFLQKPPERVGDDVPRGVTDTMKSTGRWPYS